MAAAYDSFDYPSYWAGREYEHSSEVMALTEFLEKIPRVERVLEIGGGYGRILPTYLHRAKKIVFLDPSARLLSIAKRKYPRRNIKYIHSKIENVKGKIKAKSFDMIICIRVTHHIKSLDELFRTTSKLLKKGGYLVLEFPNKRHFKAVISELFRGNITFYSDIFPKDLSQNPDETLPFINYHPDEVVANLKSQGFEIVSVRSVSNIRNEFLKTNLPIDLLMFVEGVLQHVFARFYFGPSIFILARRR